MSNKRYQGKIVRWKDDRGFGFIQTNGIKKDIFLHISALQGASHRPKAGDIIYFDLKRESDGKYKAVNASFTPMAPVRQKKNFHKQPQQRNLKSTTSSRTSYQRSRQPFSRSNSKTPQLLNAVIIGLLLAGVVIGVPKFLESQSRQTAISNQSSAPIRPEQSRDNANSQPTQTCNIKGNISYPDGKKFYHKPGYQDYAKVEIFENEGERWFCSEEEAIRAGWQDAANQ
ncbi:cold shock domain-containing protein [[Limnothrix rosea] IAM M-220]|uniref:cold shock domain-containing protein n=1 Tax=[Limnothrix rosea] IAM M-220 TaxID=454133 RepID=UPI00095B61BC|nr:cold shock domain-containing protein [[Limnothrix rosea] IAM M-220]OKH19598.1 hypothetical protein NIES208_01995 [[Limnothrix rosea] IAM M-220]